ncbi:GFA family protein [Aestuariicella hydrocarbonica]|uniref:GFA family protein n=1 Tax=Pseudomaricurvus hydrocarbonicus TaxID=1470433 RepID=A0A9E5MQD5_9GAMM|nr:GFA family protein [Aestuariicella hydrocarbonica]NHO68425.1 GFA family protein [Aestuariicella hydrocarbonica]
MSTKGSCLCGEVHFEIEGEFDSFYLCHCPHCRKDTGSAHAANLFSSTATLTWLSGHSRVREFTLPATRHVKSFCATCGSALPNIQEDGQLVVVPAGSLDDNISIRPTAHIFMASRAEWDTDLQNIRAQPGLPG